MRKMKKGRKFGREGNQRKALKLSFSANFILKGKMKTTEAKAKEFSSFIERQITGACKIIEKRDSAGKNSPESLHITKGLFKGFSSAVVKKLINEIAPKYKERKGGYTRVIKLGPRKSDGARMAIIELV
ncbi:MAG: 50S ribosomal protein L17 [Candidatus Nealsonbacteria bacterium CG_4_8_14_3_um_filter_39_7]|uniref:50S ribosomal protein L17 n=1 Tax=Candidatus Nealsonbacteria bacterium CG23_combo_of_CG06-09_8_20_14_all_39_17 TaxID=1974722 RepID=A0A2G9YVC2_9BACT|nr:MAG: 50S ribosomal protein L17 [Candidatus Nealsonbacteria bacterium CG23_combo_of_CG06-09_8_20_14_all_39_17]PIU44206.1 MAG: 50S ribosomal protein L17 [Candidatus Nealsonbacteria bacterium CG07_land_8_20_14_0_80_39_13]PIW91410.1 MAG: 50S ribosomal protein L17 [Candidatus Nealsonbacteria bacterium CG_4_8_14_3_um_filter_39_7]